MTVVLISLIITWGLPNFRRQLIRQSVKNYVQRVEAGLQSLRMKQAIVKTECKMQFPLEALTPIGENSPSNFVAPNQSIELGTLSSEKRRGRLHCSDDPVVNRSFRFLDTEKGPGSEEVEISVTRSDFKTSPPGTSVDGKSIVILIRAKQHETLNPALLIRCVELTANGLALIGHWESGRCETR